MIIERFLILKKLLVLDTNTLIHITKSQLFLLKIVSWCFNYSQKIIIIFYSLRVFQTSVSWWSFTGVWVTVSLLQSPGLFFYFCSSRFYYYFLRVFPISDSWWSFTGIWVTASFLKFSGFFSVFWMILRIPSSDFQLYQTLGDCSERTNYLHVP